MPKAKKCPYFLQDQGMREFNPQEYCMYFEDLNLSMTMRLEKITISGQALVTKQAETICYPAFEGIKPAVGDRTKTNFQGPGPPALSDLASHFLSTF